MRVVLPCVNSTFLRKGLTLRARREFRRELRRLHAGLFFGQPLFHPRPDLFVREYSALLYLAQTLVHFPDKPLVIVHQALYRLTGQRFRVTSLLRGPVTEP